MGFNFPQTKMFEPVTQMPKLFTGSRVTIGLPLALLGAALLWVFLFRMRAGFALQVGGLAPAAARYASFSSRRALREARSAAHAALCSGWNAASTGTAANARQLR